MTDQPVNQERLWNEIAPESREGYAISHAGNILRRMGVMSATENKLQSWGVDVKAYGNVSTVTLHPWGKRPVGESDDVKEDAFFQIDMVHADNENRTNPDFRSTSVKFTRIQKNGESESRIDLQSNHGNINAPPSKWEELSLYRIGNLREALIKFSGDRIIRVNDETQNIELALRALSIEMGIPAFQTDETNFNPGTVLNNILEINPVDKNVFLKPKSPQTPPNYQ